MEHLTLLLSPRRGGDLYPLRFSSIYTKRKHGVKKFARILKLLTETFLLQAGREDERKEGAGEGVVGLAEAARIRCGQVIPVMVLRLLLATRAK